MGLFAIVKVPCPHCDFVNELQSKSSEDYFLDEHTYENCPDEIMYGVVNKIYKCDYCGKYYKIKGKLVKKIVPITGSETDFLT